MIPYSVSKAGVICLTKALAKEVITEGIQAFRHSLYPFA